MILRNRSLINDNDTGTDTNTDTDTGTDTREDNKNISQEVCKSFSGYEFVKTCSISIYNVCVIVFDYTYKGIKIFINVSGIYLIWIFLHYIASHLYIKLCVPSTFIGFFMSPFMTATPHCQGLRWIVFNAANMINNMWIILGAWICSTLLIVNKDNMNTPSSAPATIP
jgi:hypothetical protein